MVTHSPLDPCGQAPCITDRGRVTNLLPGARPGRGGVLPPRWAFTPQLGVLPPTRGVLPISRPCQLGHYPASRIFGNGHMAIARALRSEDLYEDPRAPKLA